MLAALATPSSAGEWFNIVEAQTSPMRLFNEQVIAAAGASLELVRLWSESSASGGQAAAPGGAPALTGCG